MAPEDVEGAVALDEAVLGSNERAAYIRELARAGGLAVAVRQGRVAAFACLDHRYFFGRPFVSLLIVAPEARRLGLGSTLLSDAASRNEQVWTSTNRSNAPMRLLLDTAGRLYCGEVSGLDPGDPERFYRSP